MASTYSSNLKLELIADGEKAGLWGQITNLNLGTALEEAIVGIASVSFATDSDLTLNLTSNNASQAARNAALNVTSAVSLTATRNLIVPAIRKPYVVANFTTGGQAIVVKTAAGTGVTIPNGQSTWLYVDGTNVVQSFTYLPTLRAGGINATPIGATTPSTGAFTALSATGSTTIGGNLNSSGYTGTTGVFSGSLSSVGYSGTSGVFSGTLSSAGYTGTTGSFSGSLSSVGYSGTTATYSGLLSLSNNLTFTGTGQRITGDFSNATIANRVLFQTSTANGLTQVRAIPNGTGTQATVQVGNRSDPNNQSVGVLSIDASVVSLNSVVNGTGTLLPMTFATGGAERMRILTNGNIVQGATAFRENYGRVSKSLQDAGDGGLLELGQSAGGYGILYWSQSGNALAIQPRSANAAFRIDASNGTTAMAVSATGVVTFTQPPIGAGGGGFSNIQVFTGSGTFTVPAGITKVKATVVGGGGNGGNNLIGTNNTAGSGGGGGGASVGVFTVTPAQAITVTVGGAGGTSSFGTLASATGGGSGGSGTASGGAGGVGSGGQLNVRGDGGGATLTGSIVSGKGGSSIFGGGGQGVTTPSGPTNGIAGGAFGGGGGGASNTLTNTATGGAGASGVVIVEF